MVRFPLNASQKNIEKLLDFSDNRGSQRFCIRSIQPLFQ